MPTHLLGAATPTGHEMLTAQRLIVSTKRMDSAAAVTTRGKQYMERHGQCSYMYMRRSYRKKKLGKTPELQQQQTTNKYIEQRGDQCSYI
jgi:hypothetical protein